MLEKIKEYFPELTDVQVFHLVELETLVREWNEKINVISRKDTDNIFVHHILHSMAIAKVKLFKPDELVLDVGTGGGFPGIPLAIMFPETKFTLVDSIEKKIKVVKGISDSLGLANVEAMKIRAELLPHKYDCIVSRAVTAFPDFVKMTCNVLNPCSTERSIIYLKGGDFDDELKEMKNYSVTNISDFFGEEFFETKKIIYLNL
ncbi:MAG: 16S rRNA (guanine(527)-N(7))-methyltransferase RsmG [Bacteroidales bacterium]|nr:16S rRNA (guanine(527)-N(7))-methyltransferase RsmG [Bacteroidales bacterium]